MELVAQRERRDTPRRGVAVPRDEADAPPGTRPRGLGDHRGFKGLGVCGRQERSTCYCSPRSRVAPTGHECSMRVIQVISTRTKQDLRAITSLVPVEDEADSARKGSSTSEQRWEQMVNGQAKVSACVLRSRPVWPRSGPPGRKGRDCARVCPRPAPGPSPLQGSPNRNGRPRALMVVVPSYCSSTTMPTRVRCMASI